jgi:hypothetical protein
MGLERPIFPGKYPLQYKAHLEERREEARAGERVRKGAGSPAPKELGLNCLSLRYYILVSHSFTWADITA